MNKFVENGIQKQEEAYKVSFAKRQFAYSCEMCCSRGLSNGQFNCTSCPIKKAHIDALTRIQLKEKEKEQGFNYQAKKKRNGNHITIVINFN